MSAGEHKPVDLGDLRRTRPISTHWGFDRGTPIDRYYIEAFLSEHAGDVRGTVLEFGDDSYARRFGGPRIGQTAVLDIDPANPQADYHEDIASGGGLPARAFDCVICTQALHLVYDVPAAIAALARALKPGGVLLATMPGITRISVSEWPGSWFWSFTSTSVQRLFAEHFGSSNVSVRSCGNVLAATAFLYGLAVEDLGTDELDVNDPEFELSILVRAVQGASARTA
jgi:SAM-dependent methyltransferase